MAKRNFQRGFSAWRNTLLALLVALAMAACAQQPVRAISQPVVLPLPARPVLAPVMPGSIACLSDATYTTLVDRERALRTWGLELEAVIQANNHHALEGANHGH